jgi:uncharacterized tellurite resistance protein B-like protein
MIRSLKALFEVPSTETVDERRHRLNMAAAALLIETARADFTQDQVEQQALEALLTKALKLDRSEVHTLIEQASAQVDESTSLYEFTRVINDHYTPQQKLQLISGMWTVAYADGDLDKYEEALIRRVADLIYVAHEDYIRTKLKAAKADS